MNRYYVWSPSKQRWEQIGVETYIHFKRHISLGRCTCIEKNYRNFYSPNYSSQRTKEVIAP